MEIVPVEEKEKRRRSSSDVTMKEKRGKRVKAEGEGTSALMEEELPARSRKAPTKYAPEAPKEATRRRKVVPRKAAAPGQTEAKKPMVATRRQLDINVAELSLPPLKLSPRHFEEYREPVSIPSSASSSSRKSNSSLKNLQKIERTLKRKDATLVNDIKRMIEKFEDLVVTTPIQVKVAKLERPPNASKIYTAYRTDFTNRVEKKAKLILDNERTITAMSGLVQANPLTTIENIRKFKTGLTAMGITTKQIKAIKELPDPIAILEAYQEVRINMLHTYTDELKRFSTIFQTYTVQRLKHLEDKASPERDYYIAYYDTAMTQLSELLDTILEDKYADFAKLDAFEASKDTLLSLQKSAAQVTAAYEAAMVVLDEASKEAKVAFKKASKEAVLASPDINDLIDFFKKL